MQLATTLFGLEAQAHQDWFDENHETISEALQVKNKTDWQNNPSSVSNKDKFKYPWSKVQTECEKCRMIGGREKLSG